MSDIGSPEPLIYFSSDLDGIFFSVDIFERAFHSMNKFDVAETIIYIQDIRGWKGPVPEIATILFYCVQENNCVYCPANYCIKYISLSCWSDRIYIHTHFNFIFAPRFRVKIAGPSDNIRFNLLWACIYIQQNFCRLS